MAGMSLFLLLSIWLTHSCAFEHQSSCRAPNPEGGSSLLQHKRNTSIKAVLLGTPANSPDSVSSNKTALLGTPASSPYNFSSIETVSIGTSVSSPDNVASNKTVSLGTPAGSPDNVTSIETFSIGKSVSSPGNVWSNKTALLGTSASSPDNVSQSFQTHSYGLNSIHSGGIGKTANLDEAGYKKVAKLKNDEEMKAFILRYIDKLDCKVEEIGGLMGVVPWFSGTASEQSLEKLQDALLSALLTEGTPWLTYKNSAGTTGDNARLDEKGYVEVAYLRNGDEMKKFASRLAKSMHIKVIDEGGFSGTMMYYGGSAAFHPFEQLKSEIKAAAEAPHSWAEFE